jgi:type IV secretory pathway TrbL component
MWVDAPFFDLLDKLTGLQGYFLQQAWFIGRIVMLMCFGLAAIKYAIKGEGLKEPMVKLVIAFISFYILMTAYPSIVSGLNKIIFEWSYNSTYKGGVADMINNTQGNYDFWQKKVNKDSDAYSDIIRVVEEELGSGNVGKKYVLDIYDTESGFIRPNAIIRLLMLVTEMILHHATKFDLSRSVLDFILLLLTAVAVIVCGILASLQYFICALEFTFITSVGVIMLPFMLWDGSKFLTEKLIGAIVGFTMKMLFITIAMLLTFNGYLALMMRPFAGALDQMIYTVFVSLFYMMICQSGPQLAVSLLTGTPQMSLMEGAAAAGAFAAAGIAGSKAAGATAGAAAQGGVRALGAASQAAGAAGAAKELGGGKADMAGAALSSLGSSAAQGAKSMAHGMGRSLYAGNQGGGGGGGSGGQGGPGTNRFSQTTSLNEKTPDGHSKTLKEYAGERYQQGQDKGLAYMVRKEESAGSKAAEAHKEKENNDPDYKAAMAELDTIGAGTSKENDPDYKTALAELDKEFPGMQGQSGTRGQAGTQDQGHKEA